MSVGIFLIDYWNHAFREFVPSRINRLKEKGFEHIGIFGSVSNIESIEPLRFSREKTDFEYIAFAVKEAQKGIT